MRVGFLGIGRGWMFGGGGGGGGMVIGKGGGGLGR